MDKIGAKVGNQPGSAIFPGGKVRHHYLDAMRGALMFWGILVHVGTLGSDPIFYWIGKISGLVRMEAFFIISGLLGAMVLNRRGSMEFVKRRAVALLIPLAISLAVLNPPTIALMTYFHNGYWGWLGDWIEASGQSGGDEPLKGPMNWHLHLWFLISLAFYVLLAPVLRVALKAIPARIVDRVGRMSPTLVIVLLALGAGIIAIGARIGFELVLKHLIPSYFHFVCKATGYYLSFYWIGMLAFYMPAVRQSLERPHFAQAVTACCLLILVNSNSSKIPDPAAGMLILMMEAYTATALTSLLLAFSRRFASTEIRLARFLSETAYTAYLFHFLVIYGLAVALKPVMSSILHLETVVTLITLLVVSLIHVLLVKRSAVLLLLFNGRITPRSTAGNVWSRS